MFVAGRRYIAPTPSLTAWGALVLANARKHRLRGRTVHGMGLALPPASGKGKEEKHETTPGGFAGGARDRPPHLSSRQGDPIESTLRDRGFLLRQRSHQAS